MVIDLDFLTKSFFPTNKIIRLELKSESDNNTYVLSGNLEDNSYSLFKEDNNGDILDEYAERIEYASIGDIEPHQINIFDEKKTLELLTKFESDSILFMKESNLEENKNRVKSFYKIKNQIYSDIHKNNLNNHEMKVLDRETGIQRLRTQSTGLKYFSEDIDLN